MQSRDFIIHAVSLLKSNFEITKILYRFENMGKIHKIKIEPKSLNDNLEFTKSLYNIADKFYNTFKNEEIYFVHKNAVGAFEGEEIKIILVNYVSGSSVPIANRSTDNSNYLEFSSTPYNINSGLNIQPDLSWIENIAFDNYVIAESKANLKVSI